MANKEKTNLADLDSVIEAIRSSRKVSGIIAPRINSDCYDHYTEVALEIRREFFRTYKSFPPRVPSPQNAAFINENDWLRLERWFLDLQDTEIEIKAMMAADVSRKSKPAIQTIQDSGANTVKDKQQPTLHAPVKPPEGERSIPMTKKAMKTAIGFNDAGYDSFNAWAKLHDIKEAGNRQLFTVRLDGLDKLTRSRLEDTQAEPKKTHAN